MRLEDQRLVFDYFAGALDKVGQGARAWLSRVGSVPSDVTHPAAAPAHFCSQVVAAYRAMGQVCTRLPQGGSYSHGRGLLWEGSGGHKEAASAVPVCASTD